MGYVSGLSLGYLNFLWMTDWFALADQYQVALRDEWNLHKIYFRYKPTFLVSKVMYGYIARL